MEDEPQFIDLERTLALIKPDAIQHVNEIEDIILKHGFVILQKRLIHLTPEQTSEFYNEHFGKMFFPSLVAFMSSGPTLALVLAKDSAISYWRQVIGPTQTAKARDESPGSIRALFGTDNQRNAVHGSDSRPSAKREICFFFPDSIIEPLPTKEQTRDYLTREVNPTLLKGLTELCKTKPLEPMLWLADWLLEYNPNKPNIIQPVIIEEPEQ